MDSNVAAGNQWKHPKFTFSLSKTLILSVKLESIRIGTSLNILVSQYSKHKAKRYFCACNMYPNVTHCEKKLSVLFSKQRSLPS